MINLAADKQSINCKKYAIKRFRFNISQTGWFDYEKKNSPFKWFVITIFEMTDHLKGEFYHQVETGSLCNLQNTQKQVQNEFRNSLNLVHCSLNFKVQTASCFSPEDRTKNTKFKVSWSPVVHTDIMHVCLFCDISNSEGKQRDLYQRLNSSHHLLQTGTDWMRRGGERDRGGGREGRVVKDTEVKWDGRYRGRGGSH